MYLKTYSNEHIQYVCNRVYVEYLSLLHYSDISFAEKLYLNYSKNSVIGINLFWCMYDILEDTLRRIGTGGLTSNTWLKHLSILQEVETVLLHIQEICEEYKIETNGNLHMEHNKSDDNNMDIFRYSVGDIWGNIYRVFFKLKSVNLSDAISEFIFINEELKRIEAFEEYVSKLKESQIDITNTYLRDEIDFSSLMNFKFPIQHVKHINLFDDYSWFYGSSISYKSILLNEHAKHKCPFDARQLALLAYYLIESGVLQDDLRTDTSARSEFCIKYSMNPETFRNPFRKIVQNPKSNIERQKNSYKNINDLKTVKSYLVHEPKAFDMLTKDLSIAELH